MPRCLDPGARFELVLESDSGKPKDEQPAFVFRVLSMREWNLAADSEHPRNEILKAAIVDWRNMLRDGEPIPFTKGGLDEVLDYLEASELLDKLQVCYTDKKKSSLPLTSTADSSVPTAAEASA